MHREAQSNVHGSEARHCSLVLMPFTTILHPCLMQAHQLWLSDGEAVTGYEHTGCSGSMFANRLSWTLDLRGPSKAIDTACSSSLTALVGHHRL